ncbi:ATP-binding cassette domain-containing protein [Verminephrobacter aporrectodeae]|uniref:ATP-binding cassette domain-containing protein n=1 Tax=Verminephrobacter aporrectodeae TaxID=1110389 RepID=UPI0022374C77|nr:ATP-binding cassette domain-containing protein [Verminephrobacter aporrectodeae]
MIEIKAVRKSFGAIEVIRGIDLTIERGEVLCLIGASGSGKSTLLQCINSLEPIQGGQIVVDGIDVHGKSTDLNKLRQKLGIVFQQYNAFPHLTALENVALAPRVVKKMPRAQALELAREHLVQTPRSYET